MDPRDFAPLLSRLTDNELALLRIELEIEEHRRAAARAAQPSDGQQALARYVADGRVDADCPACKRDVIPHVLQTGALPYHPGHKANPWCKSGQRAHCSCEACF